MLDRTTLGVAGTVCTVLGAALLVVSFPVVIVGISDVVSQTRTVTAALAVLVRTAPSDTALHGPRSRLSFGLLGVGVGCWLLGAGLLAQGRIERLEKRDGRNGGA
ncbi:hypothetical protein A4G99_06300 [Haladaptatus sp. R4]|uniref:hypothetical protein n=1 Tax=Haladaptatus sp. R4 TaxID=1679489 RepID=UPI0007B48E74|nr:hypothetical protein [Haladaptatus sp. R4]KZN24070.1 hypothetical protein A4G99_06300 [Haladaptatus sp. R4]